MPVVDSLALVDGAVWLTRSEPGLRLTTHRPAGRDALLLEVVTSGRARILVAAETTDVRLNGFPVARLAVLDDGDRLRWGEHVVIVERDRVVRVQDVPPESVGKDCPVCRVPFTAGTRVVLCSRCGAAQHLEGKEVPERDRLECARLNPECPLCGEETLLEEDTAEASR